MNWYPSVQAISDRSALESHVGICAPPPHTYTHPHPHTPTHTHTVWYLKTHDFLCLQSNLEVYGLCSSLLATHCINSSVVYYRLKFLVLKNLRRVVGFRAKHSHFWSCRQQYSCYERNMDWTFPKGEQRILSVAVLHKRKICFVSLGQQMDNRLRTGSHTLLREDKRMFTFRIWSTWPITFLES